MSTEIKQNNWYVLRVMGGKERKTAEAIEKEIEINGMSKFVSKVLVPTEKVYQIRNGKKVSKDRNFFPGYVLIEADLVVQTKEIMSKLEKGQVLEGTVKNITSYGVFVDLGGIDGLIHITDLSWGRISHPEEIVNLD